MAKDIVKKKDLEKSLEGQEVRRYGATGTDGEYYDRLEGRIVVLQK